MAESQIMCMNEGHVNEKISESKPGFFYSEEQRVAIEKLLTKGEDEFKARLKEDNVKDFLSAREIKCIKETIKEYKTDDDDKRGCAATAESKADSGVHSTYWPEFSDTEVPPLDIGWPIGGLFKGVTRVTVHTHPPKDNGPHIKEVVRTLIQQSSKVLAVAMDLLTDLHILQDLLDAANRRNVAVYVVLDALGVPPFLDMCNRLQVGKQQLLNLRVRSVQGAGMNLSFGRLPGTLCSRYLLVDGDKVMFGSYSFSWSSARLDRNLICVMTGQVVDFFDQNFRELYAISDSLDLYKELHVHRPPASTGTLRPAKKEPKRPPLPTTTSRFQVSLGDSRGGTLRGPAHKYHNPKYLLAMGKLPGPPGQSGVPLPGVEPQDPNQTEKLLQVVSEGVPSESELDKEGSRESLAPNTCFPIKCLKHRGKGASAKPSSKEAGSRVEEEPEERSEVAEGLMLPKGKSKKSDQKNGSKQSVNMQGSEGKKDKKRANKRNCIQS